MPSDDPQQLGCCCIRARRINCYRLGSKYNVDSYPTFVVLDKNGNEVGRQEGYAKGGPKAFIAKLESFKTKG